MGIDFLPFRSLGNPRSGCWQGRFPSESPSLALQGAATSPCAPMTSSSSVHREGYRVPCGLSHKGTDPSGTAPHDLISTSLLSSKYHPIRVRAATYEFGGRNINIHSRTSPISKHRQGYLYSTHRQMLKIRVYFFLRELVVEQLIANLWSKYILAYYSLQEVQQ